MSILDTFDRRDQGYFLLLAARSGGNPDSETAASLDYQSAPAMYSALASEAYPICGTCGMLHSGLDHACGTPAPTKQRRARTIKGDIEELPPVERAAPLLENAVVKLRFLIARLSGRHEVRKGSRFVACREWREPGESYRVYRQLTRREEMEPGEWRGVCEYLIWRYWQTDDPNPPDEWL